MEPKSVFRAVLRRSNIRFRQCGTETCLQGLSKLRQQKNEPWVLDLVLLDSYYNVLHAMQMRLFWQSGIQAGFSCLTSITFSKLLSSWCELYFISIPADIVARTQASSVKRFGTLPEFCRSLAGQQNLEQRCFLWERTHQELPWRPVNIPPGLRDVVFH